MNRYARWAVAWLLLMAGLSLAAPYISPYTPIEAQSGQELQPPSAIHWFGTDEIGRDVLTRVLYGGRLTIATALVATTMAVCLGSLVGLLATSWGWLDGLVILILNSWLAFPTLLFAFMLLTLLGRGWGQVALTVGLAGVPTVALLVRATVQQLYQQEFITAARSIGDTAWDIVCLHIIPLTVRPLLKYAVIALSWAVMHASTLYYLGFGGDIGVPEWGAMLADARQVFKVAPWTAFAPGLAIMLFIWAVYTVADGLEG